jgi:hypothetical protein
VPYDSNGRVTELIESITGAHHITSVIVVGVVRITVILKFIKYSNQVIECV